MKTCTFAEAQWRYDNLSPPEEDPRKVAIESMLENLPLVDFLELGNEARDDCGFWSNDPQWLAEYADRVARGEIDEEEEL